MTHCVIVVLLVKEGEYMPIRLFIESDELAGSINENVKFCKWYTPYTSGEGYSTDKLVILCW